MQFVLQKASSGSRFVHRMVYDNVGTKKLNPLSGVDSVVSLKVIDDDLLLFHHLEGLSVLLDDV